MNRHRGQRGYSLVEMAAATFVLMVGAFGTFQLFYFGMEQTRRYNEGSVAVRAIENEIETLRALPFETLHAGERLPFTSSTPRLDKLPAARSWVAIQTDPELPDGLRQVSVHVEWYSGGRRPRVRSVSTWIAEHD